MAGPRAEQQDLLEVALVAMSSPSPSLAVINLLSFLEVGVQPQTYTAKGHGQCERATFKVRKNSDVSQNYGGNIVSFSPTRTKYHLSLPADPLGPILCSSASLVTQVHEQ